MDEGKDVQQWKDFEITFVSGGTHNVSLLEGRDFIKVAPELGVFILSIRNDDGSEREKHIVTQANCALVIERARVQKVKPAGPKLVTIGGQSIN